MTARLVVRPKTVEHASNVSRDQARDGWRVFRSDRDGYEVAIPEYQVRRVQAIATRERDEWHALVVGEIHEDQAGEHIVVRDFIPNGQAERGPAHVHVSAKAELSVRALAADLHVNLLPLGILHTHPGYSTRASRTDRAEFWSDPRAVSIIIDPTDNPTIAVYRGPSGERLVEAPRTAMPKAVTSASSPAVLLPRETPRESSRVTSVSRASRAHGLLLALSITSLMLSAWLLSDISLVRAGLERIEATAPGAGTPTKTSSPACSSIQPTAPERVPDGPEAICSEDSNQP